MVSEWHTTEAFDRDFWEFSDQHEIGRAPPTTILEWRNRMKQNTAPSLFDSPQEPNVTYYCPGRGRGCWNEVIQPGGVVGDGIENNLHETDDDHEIKQKLRVVSGVGYSNEFIEQSVRANTIRNQRKTKNPERTKNSKMKEETKTNNSDQHAFALPSRAEERKTDEKPPPLSVILKDARKDRNKKKTCIPPEMLYSSGSSSELESPVHWKPDKIDEKIPLDLSCPKGFPKLS